MYSPGVLMFLEWSRTCLNYTMNCGERLCLRKTVSSVNIKGRCFKGIKVLSLFFLNDHLSRCIDPIHIPNNLYFSPLR